MKKKLYKLSWTEYYGVPGPGSKWSVESRPAERYVAVDSYGDLTPFFPESKDFSVTYCGDVEISQSNDPKCEFCGMWRS